MCGRFVCRDHFNVPRGLCVVCIDSLCEFCGSRPSIARCIYCGKLGCTECLVQIDNVRRACRDCVRLSSVRIQEIRVELNRLREVTRRLLRA